VLTGCSCDTASELGTDRSTQQGLVCALIVAVGVVGCLAGPVIAQDLVGRVGKPLGLLSGLSVTSFGLGTVAAGLYPSPHPRHGGGVLGVGVFLLPFILLVTLWRLSSEPSVSRGSARLTARIGAAAGPMLFAVGGLLLSDPDRFGPSIEGLGQRVFALGMAVAMITLSRLLARPSREGVAIGPVV
jgi:hypothetical protein